MVAAKSPAQLRPGRQSVPDSFLFLLVCLLFMDFSLPVALAGYTVTKPSLLSQEASLSGVALCLSGKNKSPWQQRAADSFPKALPCASLGKRGFFDQHFLLVADDPSLRVLPASPADICRGELQFKAVELAGALVF